MDKTELEQYIKEKGKVTIPDVQTEFSLGYKEARELFAALEKMSVIRLENDLNFVYCETVAPFSKGEKMSFADYVASMHAEFNSYELQMLKTIIESMHPIYKSVVKFCAERQTVSVSLLQKRYHMGYTRATQMIAWLVERQVITKDGFQYKVRITEDNYCEMFGDDEDEDEDEILYDEDDDDEEDEEDNDDEEDDEDKNDIEKARAKIHEVFSDRERVEILRQELIRRMKSHMEEDDDDDDDEVDKDDEVDVSALIEDATKKRPWISAHRSFIERYHREFMQRVKECKEADNEDELFDDDDGFDLDLSDSHVDDDIEDNENDGDNDYDVSDGDDDDVDNDDDNNEMSFRDLWKDDEESEQECFDLLEKIIGTNILMTRRDAIKEVENRFDIALKNREKPSEIKVLEKLYNELLLATDEEFTKLKKAIFDTRT